MNRVAGVRSVIAALALLLGGCMVGPDYVRPKTELPTDYAASAPSSDAATIANDWWTLFGDDELDRLIKQSLAANADVKLAVARIEEADAVLRQAGAALLPEIDVQGDATRSRVSSTTATAAQSSSISSVRNDLRLALSTSFELDFWGRLRRAREAARAEALASRYAKSTVDLTLAGTVAQTYFSLRATDAQLALSRASLKSRDETLDLTRRRAAGGVASDLDVRQAEGARASIVVQTAQLVQTRNLLEHQLGVLTAALDTRLAAREGDLPTSPVPPVGLPSALLEARPDIRQAEEQLVSANARIGVVKASLFPTISLTGSFGGQSKALSDLFTPASRIWSGGLALDVPLFDFGLRSATVDQASAQQRQALASYEKAVQTAFREVSDALVSVGQGAEIEDGQRARLEAARAQYSIARIRYESGFVPYLEVLDAERTTNDAEQAYVQSRLARLQATVDLFKSLGGGWQDVPAAQTGAVMQPEAAR